VSGASTVTLGSYSIPLWLILTALAVTRLIVNVDLKKIGEMLMQITLKLVRLLLIGTAEGVWEIGTKVVAAI
jgi:hypothetical protein